MALASLLTGFCASLTACFAGGATVAEPPAVWTTTFDCGAAAGAGAILADGPIALRTAGTPLIAPPVTTAPIATAVTILAAVPAAIDEATVAAAAPDPATAAAVAPAAKPGIDSPIREAIESSGSIPLTASSSGARRRRAAVRHDRQAMRCARIFVDAVPATSASLVSAQVLASGTSATPTNDLRAR